MKPKTLRVDRTAVEKKGREPMKERTNVTEIFGMNVFNDSVMKARLPKAVYKDLKKTIEEGSELNPAISQEPSFPVIQKRSAGCALARNRNLSLRRQRPAHIQRSTTEDRCRRR